MPQKHDQDSCDVNAVFFDDGRVLYICSCCGKTWVGTTTATAGTDAEFRAEIISAIRTNPHALEGLDVDVDRIIDGLESGE